MKTILIALAFGFIGGAFLSYSQIAQHYEAKASKLLEDTAKAEQLRADKSKEQVDELYEKWRDALNVEPVTVVERLYVKAKCPVRADTSTGVDHGANDSRVELAERTVRSVTAVANKHKKQYEKCAAQLTGAQALIKAQ